MNKIIKSKIEEKFFKCSCYSHALEIVYMVEKYENDKNSYEDFYFNLWEMGRGDNNIMSWRWRFRWMWHILKTGKPYTDGIILTKEQIIDIVKFLNEQLKDNTNETNNN
jgi:hypothetical protein